MKGILRIIILFLIIFLGHFPTSAICLSQSASPPDPSHNLPSIEQFIIAQEDNFLLTQVRIKDGLPVQMKKALSSGIPIKVTYRFELLRPRLFFSKKLKTIMIERTLAYDYLKQEYRVRFGREERRVISVKDERRAQELTFSLRDIRLFNLRTITQGAVYILKLKVIIERMEDTALPLKKMIGFIWSNKIETDWNSIRFRY